MKTLFLRLLPYLISLAVGVVLYFYAISLEDQNLNSLISNIAAGFLSIPFVFICYEIVAEICDKDVKSSLLEHAAFEVNAAVIDILKIMRILLGFKAPLTKENLDDFLSKNKKYIKENLALDAKFADDLFNAKQRLQNVIYKQSNLDIMPNDRIQDILSIIKESGIIAQELQKFKKTKNKESIGKSVLKLFESINTWLDFCEENALLNHHSFSLIQE